uniref:Endothelin-converting enzyme 1 n=1 Tax=Plectus sambesii TaxID=2011161 RepID=A0A914W6V0_9BILA
APLPLRQTVWYFNTCVAAQNNFGPITQGGIIMIQALQAFQQITGLPFPMLNQNQNQQNWPSANTIGTALGYLSGVAGVDTLLSPYVDTNWADPRGSTPYFLYVDQNSLMYPKTYYQPGTWELLQSESIRNIKATMSDLASLTGNTLDLTTLSNDAMDIVKIELALARNLSTDDTIRRQYQRSYNPTTISSAQCSYPFMDWTAYFRQLSTNVPGSVSAIMNNPSFTFSVMETMKVLQLGNALQIGNPYGLTPRQFVNYLMYRLVDSNSDFLPNFRDRRLRKKRYSLPLGKIRYTVLPKHFNLERIESKDLTNAQLKCTQETLDSLSYTNARFFIDALYPDKGVNIRKAAGSLVSDILSGFESMLDQLPWMSNSSKQSAYGKITNLVKNIAFPDFILDDAQLTTYYANLNIQQTDSYATMVKKLSVFNMATKFGYLARTSGSDRTDFGEELGTTNAWYQQGLNSVTFPAGILQPPFYHPHFPASVNFGGLGSIAGHELIHGFDDEGVQWDGMGKLSNWLDSSSQQGFQRLANCIINEYNGFYPLLECYTPNYTIGSQTQGENIADNGGIHASWRAYKTHVALNGLDPRLPDPVLSQFTQDQLFFLSFARVWCVKESPAQLFRQLLDDPHSPSIYRVFGTLQNFPAFQSAFHCPSGSKYAPGSGKYCNVWVLDN